MEASACLCSQPKRYFLTTARQVNWHVSFRQTTWYPLQRLKKFVPVALVKKNQTEQSGETQSNK